MYGNIAISPTFNFYLNPKYDWLEADLSIDR